MSDNTFLDFQKQNYLSPNFVVCLFLKKKTIHQLKELHFFIGWPKASHSLWSKNKTFFFFDIDFIE